MSLCKLNLVREVDWSRQHQKRAGVIPYFRLDGELFFLLGIDFTSGDYADFGGGVGGSRFENPIEGAVREFTEESLGIFGKVDDMGDQYVIWDSDMLIIFLSLEIESEQHILQIHDEFGAPIW